MKHYEIKQEDEVADVRTVVAIDGYDGAYSGRTTVEDFADAVASRARWVLGFLPESVVEDIKDRPIFDAKRVRLMDIEGTLDGAADDLHGEMKEHLGPASMFYLPCKFSVKLSDSLRYKIKDHDRALEIIRKETDGALDDSGLIEAVSILISQRDNAYNEAAHYKAQLNGK